MDCLFCKIVDGDIPSYKVYEDELVFCFLDINPVNPGHILIIPKQHTLDVDSIDDDTLLHEYKIARKMKELVMNKLGCDGVRLVQNNGSVQEVKHYHLHVIPFYKDSKCELSVEEVYEKIK